MDEQRALLDSLMGVNRNRDRAGEEVTHFKDERVCKFFLRGVCPYEMFVNTKMDIGECGKVHSEELKEMFERSSDPYVYDSIIERDFFARISEIDRMIKRARERVEGEKMDEVTNPDTNPEVIALHSEVERLLVEIEKAADADDIDKAQEYMWNIEAFYKQKVDIITRLDQQRNVLMHRTGIDVNKKLRVCDVCGSYLSILDSDKRLADHFMGKQHIGYQVMRDFLEAVKKRDSDRSFSFRADSERVAGRASSRDREKERGDRSRDRLRVDRESTNNYIRGGGSSRGGNNSRERARDTGGGRYDYYGGNGGYNRDSRDRDDHGYGSSRRDRDGRRH